MAKDGTGMLVLSRHRGETIRICDDITITVVDIRSDKVRLGVNAPRDMPVHRGEIYDAIHGDGKASPENPNPPGV